MKKSEIIELTPLLHTMGDGTRWEYSYDGRLEVTAAARKQADGTALAGHGFGYAYDAIGNRQTATVNGRVSIFGENGLGANGLNQYEKRTVPGAVDVLGTAAVGALVLVNGIEVVRQAQDFAATVTVDNTAQAQHQALTVKAIKPGAGNGLDLVAEDSGRVFVPKTPELFSHDLDGNLTGDGRWTYEWDAENRLTAMVTKTSLPATLPVQRIEFSYDAWGRRIEKRVKVWNGTTFGLPTRTRFIYDEGWNLLAELDGSNVVLRKYLWGLDLSGSRQGAGGIGGLLVETSGGVEYLPQYDGRGNIVGLIKASDGQSAASYEYGPFGEPLAASGAMANANPFRFSTHYTDEETGLVNAKRRYYSPTAGRWLSRDLIEELGGVNLYGYVGNNPMDWIDPFGLVSLNLIETDTPENIAANDAANHFNPGGQYSVAGHGDSLSVGSLSPEQVAKLIKADPKYNPSNPVHIYACNAGSPITGVRNKDGTPVPNFAQRLANALGNTVHAPNGDVTFRKQHIFYNLGYRNPVSVDPGVKMIPFSQQK